MQHEDGFGITRPTTKTQQNLGVFKVIFFFFWGGGGGLWLKKKLPFILCVCF
jgi:hypothetical protein